ncbi:MAG: hypothetical protein A2Y65_07275 [Deltaproteobacteria bacterium RBG_13_52_11]|nr:MAG: hypothetical protein A2Y65_07275 [Deltaproteobacteria bacterium RBG_13_52_11]
MIKKIVFGLMWFVIIFIVSYIATGVIFVLSTAGAETNQAKYEAALAFRNAYIVFFLIGSLILAILGSVIGILPGMKRKPRVKKKSSVKKKAHKRGKR